MCSRDCHSNWTDTNAICYQKTKSPLCQTFLNAGIRMFTVHTS